MKVPRQILANVSTAQKVPQVQSDHQVSSPQDPTKPRRRVITLDEYRRRRQLAEKTTEQNSSVSTGTPCTSSESQPAGDLKKGGKGKNRGGRKVKDRRIKAALKAIERGKNTKRKLENFEKAIQTLKKYKVFE